MVTFNCEVCNATVPKKNTEKHYYRCPDAYYTCIDCSATFEDGVSYQKHTQCISEDEKYQKGLFKPKKQKNASNRNINMKKEESPDGKKEQNSKSKDKCKEYKIQKEKKLDKKTDTSILPKLESGSSLYKILKSIEDKETKKKLLKSLIVNENGNLVLQ